MPASAAARAIRAEINSASVLGHAEYSEGARSFRPMIARMSAQMSRYQELLIELEETEEDSDVRSKIVALQQAFRAIDRRTTAFEKEAAQLSAAVRTLFTGLLPDLLRMIDKAESTR